MASSQPPPPRHRPFERCRPVTAFRMVESIGAGTFGEVTRQQCRETHEYFALKKFILKDEQDGFPLSALREIKIMKSLRHENLLSIKEIVHSAPTDANMQRGEIYLVFECMQHDLQGLINREIRFSNSELTCISFQLLMGIFYMHRQKIIHRDLKTSNVLLSNTGVLKIADFGLARALAADVNTRYTPGVCTRWTRAPEILLGDRCYGRGVDIWSAGCIIGELFVGRPLFAGGFVDAESERVNEIDQYLKICQLCGTPTPVTWPSAASLECFSVFTPRVHYERTLVAHLRQVRSRRNPPAEACPLGESLIDMLLTMDPSRRPDANAALEHDFFCETPGPMHYVNALGLRMRSVPPSYERNTSRRGGAVEVKHVPVAVAAPAAVAPVAPAAPVAPVAPAGTAPAGPPAAAAPLLLGGLPARAPAAAVAAYQALQRPGGVAPAIVGPPTVAKPAQPSVWARPQAPKPTPTAPRPSGPAAAAAAAAPVVGGGGGGGNLGGSGLPPRLPPSVAPPQVPTFAAGATAATAATAAVHHGLAPAQQARPDLDRKRSASPLPSEPSAKRPALSGDSNV